MEKALLNQQYYPKSYRREDVKQITEHLAKFQPLTIVGLPRIGLARTLRFLLVHPEFLERKLKTKKVLLIEIDINDLFELKETSFWQLVLKRIADNSKNEVINNFYLAAVKTNDAFTFFDNTKLAVSYLCSSGYFIFLFFNRFDRLLSLYSNLFFCHLQSLKDVAKPKINFLFTSNRPLEYLYPNVFKGGNLEVFSQKYFLKPVSQTGLLPIINKFERSRKINLNPKIKEIVFKYSGGHAQYVLLILQIIEKNNFSLKNIETILNNDFSLIQQGKELWDYLNLEEKSLVVTQKKIPPNHFLSEIGLIKSDGKLFNPLFEKFVKTQINIENQSKKDLTKKEKSLLSILVSKKGGLVTREEIITFVWQEKAEDVNDWTLDQLVKRLRKDLALLKLNYQIITLKNQGYKLM